MRRQASPSASYVDALKARPSVGSSTRVTRAVLLDTPLSIDRGEVTDKGSINQRAVLDHRTGLIDALYAPAPPANAIML